MPIRTNRGRAAVYRKLWGWPLRSPRHLAVAAFVVALLLTGAGIVIPKVVGKNGGQVAAGGSSTAATTTARPGQRPDAGPGGNNLPTSSLPNRLTSTPRPTSTVPPAPDALNTVRDWAQRWVDHPEGLSAQEWLERLRPFTTREYMAIMASIEPANIRSTRLTGDIRAITSFEKSVEVEVPTDGGGIRVIAIRTDDGWRVANYEQVEGR
ncbi:hypothetical protein [Actinokineospora iranica]|uniref:Uncharacterized protein n=1 Tax=Actinokineospora iranica TaxID=1271860 RepID=A0A1G6QYT2_9PSEU|nr:hypothetical protein [Actinokineospora iranica]SDC97492.1 hypothetical protein SAMN05216174_10645 [Actinokineospora iranica]